MEVSKNEASLKKGQRAVEIAALASLGLSILKGVAGFFSGSLALISSALDSFVDFMGQVASWFGFKISRRKPSQKFPYGYYKAESLATLLISLLIVYAAARLFLEGYSALFLPPGIDYLSVALAVAAVNIFASYLLARHFKKAGEEISSPLLLACSKERQMDIFSGAAVFIAVAAGYFSLPYIEGLVVMGLSFLIFKVGASSVRDAAYVLMDVSPSRAVEREVRKAVESIGGIKSISGLRLRKSGPFIFGDVKVRVNKELDVYQAHELSEQAERRAKEKVVGLDTLTVHIEPCRMGKCRAAVPIKEDKGLDSPIAEGFGNAKYLLFADMDMDGKKIISFFSEKNPASGIQAKKGILAAEYIAKKKADFAIAKSAKPGLFRALKAAMIEPYISKGDTAKEALEGFLEGGLEKMAKPENSQD